MSTASKITLGASILLCASTVIGVYYLSESERDVSTEKIRYLRSILTILGIEKWTNKGSDENRQEIKHER